MSLFGKIFKTGIITERFDAYSDAELNQIGAELKRMVDRRFRGSLIIRQVDPGSCNGCELEINALSNGFYDIEQYGINFAASPRHADVLMVTGPVARHMQAALLAAYEATPEPKWVIAVGTCAANGGEFGQSYASCGAVEQVIPVDLVIPGCPPTPLNLMKGLLKLAGR
jgi:Ni,Fe-hydrogenase III small subunit